MFSQIAKSSRVVLSLGIFAFLAVGFLSLSHVGMGMNGEMSMSECPFMSEMVICDMNALEHLAGWQSIFSSILAPEIIVWSLILLAVIALPYWTRFFSPPKDTLIRLRFAPLHNRVPIPSIFQYLFSKGILHPKLF